MRCSSRLATLAVISVLLGASPAAAQGIGARGGVNFSNISFDDADVLTTKAQVGFVVGGFVTFRQNAAWGLQIEGQVARRVVRFESIIDDTMTYLEIPVLVRIAIYRGDTLVVRGLGGVSANYLISATESVDGGDPYGIKGALEPWEFAAVFGADAELKGRWIIGARYVYGLTQVYRESSDFPARQQGFQITAGYRFR